MERLVGLHRNPVVGICKDRTESTNKTVIFESLTHNWIIIKQTTTVSSEILLNDLLFVSSFINIMHL